MYEIIIIGNSGAARECYQLLLDCQLASPTLRFSTRFKGFLRYKGFKDNLFDLSTLCLGEMDEYDIRENDQFVIGIGKPSLRCEIYNALKLRGASFINIISPWSYIPNGFLMGDANIISSHCNFSCQNKIGNGNYFNGGVRVGHDVTIGDFNFFGPSTTILGSANIGNANMFAVQSTVLDHAKVGDDNHIAPGSIIFKGCRDNCKMFGNPALRISNNFE